MSMERYSKGCRARVQEWLHGWWAHCRLCGQPGTELCADCQDQLPVLAMACPGCARPLAVAGPRCGQCQRRAPAFGRAWAAWHYAAPLDALLPRLKYRGDLALARWLGERMAERLPAGDMAWAEGILPVPLHRWRLVRRGFNQAVELARPCARASGLPLLMHGVRRRRDTPAQVGQSLAARRRNLRGCFEVTAPLPRRLLLFDDVMTTGATVEELARTLRQAGIETRVWAVARA